MDSILAKDYVEVLEVLKYMEPKYIRKIPKKMIESFEENKDNNYKITINPRIPLKNQNLRKGTLEILALLNLKYWCNSLEEKQRLLKKYQENDIKYQNKYDLAKVFEKNRNEKQEQKTVIEYKEIKWYNKILMKIKSIFK